MPNDYISCADCGDSFHPDEGHCECQDCLNYFGSCCVPNYAQILDRKTCPLCGPLPVKVRFARLPKASDGPVALTDAEKIHRFDYLQKLMSNSPIGWIDGRVHFLASTTQADIIQWLCDVQNICAIDKDGTQEEVVRIQERRKYHNNPDLRV